jgi:hypothetical protein
MSKVLVQRHIPYLKIVIALAKFSCVRTFFKGIANQTLEYLKKQRRLQVSLNFPASLLSITVVLANRLYSLPKSKYLIFAM